MSLGKGATAAELDERLARLGIDPADAIRMGQRQHALRTLVARHDPDVFCRFVLRDEKTGKPIAQAPMHKRMHELMSQNARLVMWSHVEGGKTTQVAIGRVLFELGLDPTLRVCVVSNTNDLAKKMTRLIGQYVEKSGPLHEVFPELVPTDDPNLPWKAQALTIARPTSSKDPSIQACGVHGNVIGSRIDLLVLDDVLDHENTHTPGPRQDVWHWIRSTLFSRLTEAARVWVVGNAWHPEDAMHKMEKEERFRSQRFPVQSATGELTWPERWSTKRIETARQDLGPMEFSRQLMCQARDDTSARFKREWIDVAIDAGKRLAWCESSDDLFDSLDVDEEKRAEMVAAAETIWRLSGKGHFFTGVDLAISKRESADMTCLFTIYVDEKKRRRVLNIESGRWSGPEIRDHVKDVYRRFGSIFIIENNAMQKLLIDMLQDETDIPIVPFTTGQNKAHPEFGVEALATELAGGKWLIPNDHLMPNGKVQPMHKEVGEWISEMLFYDPKEHTGDRLMASWFAREGARKFVDGAGARSVGVRII